MPKQLLMSETKVAAAVSEILEDRMKDVIKHCQDHTTQDGKPCEVTIKVIVTPNKTRDQFTSTVTGSAKLSPRYSAESTLFAGIRNGEVEISEYNPVQAVMNLNE